MRCTFDSWLTFDSLVSKHDSIAAASQPEKSFPGLRYSPERWNIPLCDHHFILWLFDYVTNQVKLKQSSISTNKEVKTMTMGTSQICIAKNNHFYTLCIALHAPHRLLSFYSCRAWESQQAAMKVLSASFKICSRQSDIWIIIAHLRFGTSSDCPAMWKMMQAFILEWLPVCRRRHHSVT